MGIERSILRREFLKRAALCSACGISALKAGPAFALAGSAVIALPEPGAMDAYTQKGMPGLQSLSAEHMSRFIGTRFRIFPDAAPPLDVELEKVDLLATHVPRPEHLPRPQAFAAVFRSREAVELAQETYTVVHASLGRIHLCIGTVPGPGAADRLEAIFN